MNLDTEALVIDIREIILEVIRCNTPYSWIAAEEPFYNIYKDKVSFDYSGEVVIMNREMLKEIKDGLGQTDLPYYPYSSTLEEFLSNIHINRWEASYESNRGKNWISYHDLVLEKYEEYKHSHYNLYNEDDELDDNLDIELDEVLYEFINNEYVEFYYNEVLDTVKEWRINDE